MSGLGSGPMIPYSHRERGCKKLEYGCEPQRPISSIRIFVCLMQSQTNPHFLVRSPLTTADPSIALAPSLLQRFSRVTSSGEFIPEIDGLRFIAIMAVIFHHLIAHYLTETQRLGPVNLPAEWYQVYSRSRLVSLLFPGYFGVHLFFVISGFILALPFARRHFGRASVPALKRYYLRRLTRMEPPYIINISLAFACIWFTNSGHLLFLPHFIASLFYSHGLVYGEASWINGVAWSLEIEVQFYLIVPMLAAVFAVRDPFQRRALIIGAVIFFGVASQWLIAPSGIKPLKMSVLNYLQYFLAGFLLVELHLSGWILKRPKTYIWDAAALLFGIAIIIILMRFPKLSCLLPLAVLLFYASLFRGKLSHAFITLKGVVVLGGMCYTTYLYHTYIISYLHSAIVYRFLSPTRSFPLDFLVYVLPQIIAIFFLSSCVFLWTEKPFMKIRPKVAKP